MNAAVAASDDSSPGISWTIRDASRHQWTTATRARIVGPMTFLRSLLHLNPWTYLFAAGFAEMGFTSFMKLSNGFQKVGYDVAFAACAIASFVLLNLSTRSLSLGTAYAVWTGLGAFGTAIIGMMFFGDSTGLWRLLFLTTLIGSIIGLRLVSS